MSHKILTKKCRCFWLLFCSKEEPLAYHKLDASVSVTVFIITWLPVLRFTHFFELIHCFDPVYQLPIEGIENKGTSLSLICLAPYCISLFLSYCFTCYLAGETFHIHNKIDLFKERHVCSTEGAKIYPSFITEEGGWIIDVGHEWH